MVERVLVDNTPKEPKRKDTLWQLDLLRVVVLAFLLYMVLWYFTFNDPTVKPDPNYPKSVIRLIVPYAPGGSVDLLGRSMEHFGLTYLGEPIAVVNMPGGGGIMGWDELASVKPNGYTIGIVNASTLLEPLFDHIRYPLFLRA